MERITKICLFVSYILYYSENVNGESICKVPNGGAGTCVRIEECKPLMDLYRKKFKTENDNLFFQQSSCTPPGSRKMKMCCPARQLWPKFDPKPVIHPKVTRVPWVNDRDTSVVTSHSPEQLHGKFGPASGVLDNGPTPAQDIKPIVDTLFKELKKNCGQDSSSADKIVGGEEVAIDEYPWLALLEYADGSFKCGGSIISSRFILTAAHCIYKDTPVIVRLAEYNTTSYPTDVVATNGGGNDSIEVVFVGVEDTYTHPNYSGFYKIHDIGLIMINETIDVTQDFIKNICLPFDSFLPKLIKPTNFTIAGWGDTKNGSSDVKLQVDVPYVPWERCEKVMDETLMNTQICAGGLAGKDSCSGDSGGPLMYMDNNVYYAIGVLSYGAKNCGTEGHPATHTNVNHYVPWLVHQMAEAMSIHSFKRGI